MNTQQRKKVICLGLGRTGTSSLRDALEMLGFGPCHHMFTILFNNRLDDFALWRRVFEGKATIREIKASLDEFGAFLDYPTAMHPAELYAAYPDAKFILTTRNPASWEKSMKNTILKFFDIIRTYPKKKPIYQGLSEWAENCLKKYHNGRIETHAQQELLDHNERVKKLIPAEQLLIYEVTEGWDRLVEFLGVPKPNVPFPHVNTTNEFQDFIRSFERESGKENCVARVGSPDSRSSL